MRTYWWDFSDVRHDGHGEGTAKQFLLHLQDYLRDQHLQGSPSGVVRTGPGGYSAWCKVEAAAGEVIVRDLKPSRASDEA